MLQTVETNVLGFRLVNITSITRANDTNIVVEIIGRFMPGSPKKRAARPLGLEPDFKPNPTSNLTPTVDVQLTEIDAAEQARRTKVREMIDLLSLSTPLSSPAPGSWRNTIGMFDDDPAMQEIFSEAVRIREANRRDECSC